MSGVLSGRCLASPVALSPGPPCTTTLTAHNSNHGHVPCRRTANGRPATRFELSAVTHVPCSVYWIHRLVVAICRRANVQSVSTVSSPSARSPGGFKGSRSPWPSPNLHTGARYGRRATREAGGLTDLVCPLAQSLVVGFPSFSAFPGLQMRRLQRPLLHQSTLACTGTR